MGKIRIVDTETSLKNIGDGAIGTFKSSPHHPDNYVVWFGIHDIMEDLVVVWKYGKDGKTVLHKEKVRGTSNRGGDPQLLVGQNIKFDLLHIMNQKDKTGDIPKIGTMRIWDTMVVEYLITGQESTMKSLDELATKYGGNLKDDRLKEMWDAGIDTEDIDDDIVKPYLIEDLNNTALVFKGQLAEVRRLGMMPLVKSQMDAMLATLEMEFNGMYFDKSKAKKAEELLSARCKVVKENAYDRMLSSVGQQANPLSNHHVSITLFGGSYETEVTDFAKDDDDNIICYKSGKRKGLFKTKKVKEMVHTNGFGLDPHKYDSRETKHKEIYTVGDDVLKNIMKDTHKRPVVVKFCKDILDIRAMEKDLKTYYRGYSEVVWPHDSCIHANFNHAVTTTGRLSHSGPNLGNVSHEDD